MSVNVDTCSLPFTENATTRMLDFNGPTRRRVMGTSMRPSETDGVTLNSDSASAAGTRRVKKEPGCMP